MSFRPDHVILAWLSGSFAPYPFSALAGHYDDEGVIYLRQLVVNVMQSECRVMSQKREGILLANLHQSSRSTLSWGSFLNFFAFKEGMLGTPISILGGWPTVSGGFLTPPSLKK